MEAKELIENSGTGLFSSRWLLPILGAGAIVVMMGCTAAQLRMPESTVGTGDDRGEIQGDPVGGEPGTGETEDDLGGDSEDVAGGGSTSEEDTSVSLEDLFEIEHIEIKCESWNYKKHKCKIDSAIKGRIHSATVIEQLSVSECINGQSFKTKKRRLIVKAGCRAIFDVLIIRPKI